MDWIHIPKLTTEEQVKLILRNIEQTLAVEKLSERESEVMKMAINGYNLFLQELKQGIVSSGQGAGKS